MKSYETSTSIVIYSLTNPMDNNLKTLTYIFFWILPIIIILMFVMKAYSLSNVSEEDSQKLIELIENAEKKAIVQDVKHEVLKWPKYTIRVGLQWSRKPIPAINGLTTEERAKEWLEKASLGYTLPTWIKLGEKYKVDYALPICIAWADSHLGKALKSTNNIGNVGNRDDGSVVHYDSLDKWIEAIYRVLNNKYLWGNTELGELSGEWRIILKKNPCTNAPAPKKCYATSTWVWHTNVRNCLSVIHNTEIKDNHIFRL